MTSYAYDMLNRLTTLTPPSAISGAFGFSYDVLSRRTQMARPNGVNTNYTYDSLSRLLSALHQKNSATLDGATYTYDAVGNRSSKTANGFTTSFTYDLIYELSTALPSGPGGEHENYGYDAVGNRLTSQSGSYTYDVSNHLVTSPGASYTYDANGDTLTKTVGSSVTSYTWDYENRLTSVSAGGTTTSFKYDPFGRRIQKISASGNTAYAYDGDNVIEELNSFSPTSVRYAQGLGIDEPLAREASGSTYYYEADGLGSITSLTDSTGARSNTYIYDSFGYLYHSTGSVTNPYRFTAREFDSETGLYYYRARYYDPTVGRFLSEDPIGFQGGASFYPYALNDPVNWADPKGLQRGPGYAIVGAGVGVTVVTIGSIAADYGSGGLNILATPAELGAGASLGGSIGYGIGILADTLADAKAQILLAENTRGVLNKIEGLLETARSHVAKCHSHPPDDPNQDKWRKEVKAALERARNLAEKRLPGKLSDEMIHLIDSLEGQL